MNWKSNRFCRKSIPGFFFMVRYNDVRLVGTLLNPSENLGLIPTTGFGPVIPEIFHFLEFTPAPTMSPRTFLKATNPLHQTFSSCFNGWCERRRFYHGFGFPGRTDEYLPSIAVKQIMENSDPAKIAIRDAALKSWISTCAKMRVHDLNMPPNMQPSPTIGKMDRRSQRSKINPCH